MHDGRTRTHPPVNSLTAIVGGRRRAYTLPLEGESRGIARGIDNSHPEAIFTALRRGSNANRRLNSEGGVAASALRHTPSAIPRESGLNALAYKA